MNERSTSKRTLLFFYIVIIGFLVLYYCVQIASDRSESAANPKDGVLDLTGIDWQNARTLKLDGGWTFYWGKLLTGGPSPTGPEPEPTGTMRIPGHWSGRLNGTELGSKGFATYRLRLKLTPSDRTYGIRIANIQMSSALYVNGRKIGGSGEPGPARSSYKPENKPYNAYFTAPDGTADLVIQAANFDFVQGGVPNSIRFGTVEAITGFDKTSTIVNIALEMSVLLLGLYHIGAYLTRREEKGFLYFGLYCICAAVGYAAVGDKLFMQLFPRLPFELSYKLQTSAISSTMIMLALFMKHVFPSQAPSWLPKTASACFGMFLLFTALFPFHIFSRFTYGFSGLQIIVYLIVIASLSKAYLRGQYGTFTRGTLLLLIAAFCCLAVTIVDASLYLLNFLPNNYFGYGTWVTFAVIISGILSWRFAEAYRTVERLSKRLRETDRIKDEFLANTSHEFQTPLSGIINISQSLIEGAGGDLNDKQKTALSTIVSVSERLSMLVRDILDMERMKRSELQLQPTQVDVKVLVSVVLDLFPYLSSGKNVRLLSDVPSGLPLVAADENRLRQVLYNLVGNAFKFTERGTVSVSAAVAGDYVEIAVEDTGIGISEQCKAAVFEAYEQGDDTISGQYGGNGLGLAIAGKLMRLMGGELRLDWSEVGAGTRFVCRLRAHPGTATARMTEAAEETAVAEVLPPLKSVDEGAVFTLLAVDDEPANLQVLLNLFGGRDGYRLLTAGNGEEALRLLEQERGVDLVLLDVMMPKLSGFDVCRAIRKRYAMFDLPVIMLTALGTGSDMTSGFEAGANDFILKPFDASVVRARVRTLLMLKKSVRDALASEMAFLQSQIKPHFLFNALSAILSFCHTDSGRAAELIAHLSRYLRKSFDIPGTETFVRLEDELQLVDAYVEIEKARFAERLNIVYDIEPNLHRARLLPLTVQPLVENAIRHGIMKKEDGGTVRLIVRSDDGGLRVEVRDDGVGMPPDVIAPLLAGLRKKEGSGVGLANIHRRLINLYGDGLTIESREGAGTTVCLRVRPS